MGGASQTSSETLLPFDIGPDKWIVAWRRSNPGHNAALEHSQRRAGGRQVACATHRLGTKHRL